MRSGRDSNNKNTYLWWVSAFVIVVALSFKLPVGQQLNLIFAPVLHAIQAPARWYDDFALWFDESSSVQQHYLELQHELAQQQVFQQELETLRAENEQLRELLDITQMDGYVWRAASVVSRGPEKKSRRLMLQVDAANEDDVVISHEGLVGLIDVAGYDHATVRTILDASIAVPVTMQGSNLSALVRGDGEHLLVDFVPLIKAPKVGDILITSGAGGIFPAGLSVAKVESVKAIEGGVFAEITAEPVASWQRDAWLAVAARIDID